MSGIDTNAARALSLASELAEHVATMRNRGRLWAIAQTDAERLQAWLMFTVSCEAEEDLHAVASS
jgi:hypothetical protein